MGMDSQAFAAYHAKMFYAYALRHFPDSKQRIEFLNRIDVDSELRAKPEAGLQEEWEAADRATDPLTGEEVDKLSPEEREAYNREQDRAYLMSELGITPKMSRTAKRRKLQPEFDFAYGKVDRKAFQDTYGMSEYNRVNKEFGPRFWAKKGQGRGLDEIAQEWFATYRGNDNPSLGDSRDFAEAVMMTHTEFHNRTGKNYYQEVFQAAQSAKEQLDRYEHRRANYFQKYNPDGPNTELDAKQIDKAEKVLKLAIEAGYDVNDIYVALRRHGFCVGGENTATAAKEYLKDRMNGTVNNRINDEKFLNPLFRAVEAAEAASQGSNRDGALYHALSEKIRAGDEALKRDAKAWGQSVDSFIEGTLPTRKTVTMLKQTPLVLQMLGAKNLPVNTTYGVLKKVLVDKHKLPPETLKQVPEAMADPVMVFKSATQSGDLVMMLELKDQHGATVVVPVALEQAIPGNYTVNLATSVYGRQGVGTTTPNNRWFLNQIQDGNLLYQNKEKSRAWAAMVGLSLPPMYRSSSAKGRIHTEADLVKLREENPTLYQTEPPATRADEFSDARYFAAVEAGDMETAQRFVDHRAAQQGYISPNDYRMNHRAPSSHDEDVSTSLANLKKSGLVPDDYWTHPQWYLHGSDELASFHKIRAAMDNKRGTIIMFRAVPKNVKEGSFRNGDWITPSREYARGEGEQIPGGYRIIEQRVKISEIWWDANSINEFGYDDGKGYAYKNTRNNRKLTDVVVRDSYGTIVPPSKRFNARKYETYYQRNETRVKFDAAPTADVTGEEIFSLSEPVNISDAREKALEWGRKNGIYREDYTNTDTGWTEIALREKGVEDTLRHGGGPEKIQSVPALPAFIRDGIYLETTPSKDTKQIGMKSHVFAAKMDLAGKPMVVGFIIKEDMNGRRFYDHELTEIKNLDEVVSHSGAAPANARGRRSDPRQGSVMNIVRKHLGVKPDVTLQHQTPVAARASLEITQGKDGLNNYKVLLGNNSNLSSLIHETGHIFELELRRLVESGLGDQRMAEDLGKLDSWLSRFDDDAVLKDEYNSWLSHLKKGQFNNKAFEKLSHSEKEELRNIAKREYFARGFETYAREGKTPSEGLRGIFARFKQWLLNIYKDANRLGVEINDDVRGVFDRMLATENEISISAAVNEMAPLDQAYLGKLGVTSAESDYQAELLGAAARKVLADIEQLRNKDRVGRLKAWEKEAREELMKDPVYQAREAMRAKDGFLDADIIAETYGKTALQELRNSAGPGVDIAVGGKKDLGRKFVKNFLPSVQEPCAWIMGGHAIRPAEVGGIGTTAIMYGQE